MGEGGGGVRLFKHSNIILVTTSRTEHRPPARGALPPRAGCEEETSVDYLVEGSMIRLVGRCPRLLPPFYRAARGRQRLTLDLGNDVRW